MNRLNFSERRKARRMVAREQVLNRIAANGGGGGKDELNDERIKRGKPELTKELRDQRLARAKTELETLNGRVK